MSRAQIILLLIPLAACSRKSSPPAEPTRLSALPTYATDIYPLANGDALVVVDATEGAAVFMLSGAKGVKLTGVPTDAGVPDVYPLANGGAYLAFGKTDGLGIYLLNGRSLVPVRESTELSSGAFPPTAAGFAWADRVAATTRSAKKQRELEREEAMEAYAAQEQ